MINLIAYGIAKACKTQGAKIAFTYLNDSLKKELFQLLKSLKVVI